MSTRPGEHQGLGLAHYLWASSPLRRYSDLVNQRQLLAAVRRREAAVRRERRRALRRADRFRGDLFATTPSSRIGMEHYWCLRWLLQEGVTETTATVIRDNLVRFDRLPLVVRLADLPALAPDTRGPGRDRPDRPPRGHARVPATRAPDPSRRAGRRRGAQATIGRRHNASRPLAATTAPRRRTQSPAIPEPDTAAKPPVARAKAPPRASRRRRTGAGCDRQSGRAPRPAETACRAPRFRRGRGTPRSLPTRPAATPKAPRRVAPRTARRSTPRRRCPRRLPRPAFRRTALAALREATALIVYLRARHLDR